jgi:hypothetical protein
MSHPVIVNRLQVKLFSYFVQTECKNEEKK